MSTTNNPTFVHKLYNMVLDEQFQHLIAWSYTGASFVVCNIMAFARDVLPKHFKHNNFSSFVRQLNMYGFHKVNKSPRGHRTLAENQIWEFSHSKFLRGRTDLLDDIKRKSIESDTVRRETDLHAHLTMLQMSQSDMLQQIHQLYSSFSHMMREFYKSKKQQEYQAQFVKTVVDYLLQSNGGELPHELQAHYRRWDEMNDGSFSSPPPIFVTGEDTNASLLPPHHQSNLHRPSFLPSSPNSAHGNMLHHSPSSATLSCSPLPTTTAYASTSTAQNNNMMHTSTTASLQPTTVTVVPSTSPHLLSTSSMPFQPQYPYHPPHCQK
ncbi:HSF-type DNA-binding-domain-containing protein [Mycotypha africana]|uniref:HSF-type DNA-binding-domain-containing protein n=1 Tax=Mycotypha africana TaxID=64632 RepID=UPI00230069A5|nr:HSF-type DNA-binding-domain-containing protein [Mycotypha africana]KAI8973787.1 HSF-type DNA-binding-domain-containing protein [Mycotypha africana]